MKFTKYSFVLFLCLQNTLAQNLNYALHDIHTLTIPKGQFTISYTNLMMNDTVDLFKIKEKEFGNNPSFDSIGDMNGNNYKLRYGISEKLMFVLNYSNMNIEFGDSELLNKSLDIFARYNIIQNSFVKLNSGISIDIGYVTNKLDDVTVDNISELDSKKNTIVSQIDSYDIQYSDGTSPIYNEPFPRPEGYYILNNNVTTPLDDDSYDKIQNARDTIDNTEVLLENNNDKSQYVRLLTGFYNKNSTIDFFAGYKKTKIESTITLDMLEKLKLIYNDLEDFAALYNKDISGSKLILDDIEKNLNRTEQMFFMGFNYALESKDFIYEFGLEYDKFKRDDGLDYIDYNVVIDAALNYKYSDNIILFTGARLMYRQLNGQIPYLYNEYTQTSYDHKYGYTKFGVQYRF